jgi:hypothetical protein
MPLDFRQIGTELPVFRNMGLHVRIVMQAQQGLFNGEVDVHEIGQLDEREMYGRPFVVRAYGQFEARHDIEQNLVLLVDLVNSNQ